MADLIQKTDTLNDGREKLNKAIEHVDTFQRQIDEIVIEGDSSVEAAQARMDTDGRIFSTLKSRLDAEQTAVTSQLAEKASQSYVDALMASITDGSPKELFYSTAALFAKYPNGAVGPMLVFDSSFTNGAHSYIWNNTGWVDIGLYQATESSNFPATNKVSNGDFDTRANWSSTASNNTANNKVLSNTADGSANYGLAYYGFTDLVPGRKYYFRGKVNVTNSNATYIRLRATYTTESQITINNPTMNTVYDLSGIFTATDAPVSLQFIHGYADAATANGKVMELQYVLGLDLTAIFGAGYEPTVEVIDSIMATYENNWFKGTKSPLFENSDLYKYVTDLNKPFNTLAKLNLNGLIVKNNENFIRRVLTGTTNQITVTNGDGVSGNPTISIPEGATGIFRPSVVSPSFGAEMSPPLSTYTGSKASWDGSKWIVSPGGTLSANISVVAGKEYQIEMTFSNTNAYNTDVVPKFIASLGTAKSEKQFAGYSDALYKFTLKANVTGDVTLQLGDGIELWEAEITSITIKEVTGKTTTAGRLGLGSFNIFTAGTNFALGGGHAQRTSGVDNSAYGFVAQNNLTTGIANNAFGARAQERITIGCNNNAFGYGAQRYLTSGYYNIGIGYSAQSQIQDGSWNIGIGNECQRDITSGNRNTTVGSRAHNSLTTGSWNVAMGREAGFNADGSISKATITGNKQVTIGAQSGQSSSDQADEIVAVGYRASSTTNGTALGAQTKANGVGSVAIGKDSEGNSARTDNQDEFLLGTPLHKVKVAGTLNIAQRTPNGTSDPQGQVGDITSDDNHIYVKTSTGWKRSALSTW